MRYKKNFNSQLYWSVWRHAQLSLRRGGFGLRSLAPHSSAAYTTFLCGSDDVISTSQLENPITHYNTCVSLSDSLSISSLDSHTPAQKKLSDAIEEMQFNSLLNSCSLADKARLLSVLSPHTSAWISVVPSLSSGLHLDPNELQTAVKWWLGVNPSLNLMEIQWFVLYAPTVHLTLWVTTVSHAREKRAGLSAHLEVGCGWGQDNSRTRPADILVTNWVNNMLEAGMYQGVSAKAAEHRKHTENDPKCVELGWQCMLLAVECYGAWGPEALRAGGNLTALNKPIPGDICPIAVGEALWRLTGKCLCAALRSKMASFFEPYQFGVAFSCGAEKIAHGLRTCIEQHWLENDFGVLKVDMTNAFNLVSRQAILSECAKHFPELLPWVSWCYGQHPLLWHHLGCLTSESGVQQGDPLGPLLFSLVLNILVMKVARDSACSNLPFHAWYLDDGVMAGPRSSLCRILSLLQEEGPALGIIVNLPKCEAFSRHGLDMFPLRMKKSDKPSLEILGIPIGDQEFCSSFISKKHTKAKILLSLFEEVGIVDPQVALILLRLCGAFCKLVHLARATPSTLTSKVFALIDDDIRMTFCRCIGVDMSDTAWQQAQLSPSRGGLGFWSLSRHSSAAFISSSCSSGFGLQSSHHLSQAIETFNSLVSPADAVSVESLLTSSVSQKYLSGKLDDRVFNILLNSSSVADKARLLSVSSPHAASWLSVVPSENLGLHLDPPVFQVAIKWWLGLDTSEGSQCALCPGSTLDHLGHHAVTCKYGGDVVSRHNRIRDILVETCRRAHIGVKVEVGNNLSRDHSKTHPADILLPNWFLGRTAALDVSITSPLNPVTLLEAGVSATAAAQATEARKHQANDPKCSELGWVCVPMVVETYGAWGKEATAIISSVASRLATSTCRPKSTILHEIYGRLNLNPCVCQCHSYPF
ncbi:hypothetical protein EMCRGX_G021737 [Ephydatia muelleri]